MRSKWWAVYRAVFRVESLLVVVALLTACWFGFLGLKFSSSPQKWMRIADGLIVGWGVVFMVFVSIGAFLKMVERIPESEPPERIKNAIKRRQTKDHDKRGGVSFVASEGGEITEVEQ